MSGGVTEDEAAAIRTATETVIAYRAGLEDRPIPAEMGPDGAAEQFFAPLPEDGAPASQVIDEIVAKGDAGLTGMAAPGFFGFVIGGAHPAGVAADILTGGLNQVTGYWAMTPTTAALEQAACQWVIELLGLPAGCGAGIVTGATLANASGVMAARHALLRRANWDVEANGLYGAPEIQVIVGEEAHSAVHAALRYAGLGYQRVHAVPSDAEGRMRADAFAETLAQVSGPILVILQSGHVNSGAQDPFDEIIPLAHERDAWVHVDGAFGLWVHAVPELARRAAGVDKADSWAVDLHKWLQAPYDAGMVITRDRAHLLGAMSAKGSYLPEEGEFWDPNDTTMELSRRARGVPSYAILKTLGANGVRQMVARHWALAARAADGLARLPGVTVLNAVAANQVTFACGDGEDGDRLTTAVLARVQACGRSFPSHAVWKGRQIIRVSVSGYLTEERHIDALVEDVAQALDAEAAGQGGRRRHWFG